MMDFKYRYPKTGVHRAVWYGMALGVGLYLAAVLALLCQ